MPMVTGEAITGVCCTQLVWAGNRSGEPGYRLDRGEFDELDLYQIIAFAYTSKEAFVALRRLGKTVTLLGYPDEGHGGNRPENQVDFTNRALDWFDQYLKPSSTSAGAN